MIKLLLIFYCVFNPYYASIFFPFFKQLLGFKVLKQMFPAITRGMGEDATLVQLAFNSAFEDATDNKNINLKLVEQQTKCVSTFINLIYDMWDNADEEQSSAEASYLIELEQKLVNVVNDLKSEYMIEKMVENEQPKKKNVNVVVGGFGSGINNNEPGSWDGISSFQNEDVVWTMNGFDACRKALFTSLQPFDVIGDIVNVIASYVQPYLDDPDGCNTKVYKQDVDPIQVDKSNPLLAVYTPITECDTWEQFCFVRSHLEFDFVNKHASHVGNLFYCEMKLLQHFDGDENGLYDETSFGLTPLEYPSDYGYGKRENGGNIGWSPKTIAIHSDNGRIYTGRGSSEYQSDITGYGQGDTVGCGMFKTNHENPDPQSKVYVFFTHNGKLVSACDIRDVRVGQDITVDMAKLQMKPAVAFRGNTELNKLKHQVKIEWNFGIEKKFVFDLSKLTQAQIQSKKSD